MCFAWFVSDNMEGFSPNIDVDAAAVSEDAPLKPKGALFQLNYNCFLIFEQRSR